MTDIDIRYVPPPTLKRFLKSNARVRGIVGPVGSGKSSVSCIEALRRACSAKPCIDGVRRTRGAIIRNTYPELRDTTRKTFEEWVPGDLGRWYEAENRFVMEFDDGKGPIHSEILFRALDRPDDVKKLLSLELTWAYINEAKEVPRPVFDMLQARVGRYPAKKSLPPKTRPWFGIWFDTNPPDTDHWIYRIFEEKRPEGFELYRQPDGLGPDAENLENLPDGYYPNISVGKDQDWINVYVRGQYGFVKDGRPVFAEWNDRLHVAEVKGESRCGPILVGMDFGLTPAAVIAQRDPSDGQIQVLEEFWSDDMGALPFAEELNRRLQTTYPGRTVRGHGDPAGDTRDSLTGERTSFDALSAAGLGAIRPAPTNDPVVRIETVRNLLRKLTIKGRPALVVSPTCLRLRKAMGGGYCYRRVQVSGDERFKDKPEKNGYSHISDALQYLACGEGEDRKALKVADPDEFRLNIRVRRSMGRY